MDEKSRRIDRKTLLTWSGGALLAVIGLAACDSPGDSGDSGDNGGERNPTPGAKSTSKP